jgi:hypothetical protein
MTFVDFSNSIQKGEIMALSSNTLKFCYSFLCRLWYYRSCPVDRGDIFLRNVSDKAAKCHNPEVQYPHFHLCERLTFHKSVL